MLIVCSLLQRKGISMRIFVLLTLMLITACGSKHSPEIVLSDMFEPSGNITDLHTGKLLTAQQLLLALSKQPVIIIGEQHDNVAHHQIEHWLIDELPHYRPQGSILMEMFTPDHQVKIDTIKNSLYVVFPDNGIQLMQDLNWKQSWNWALYGPIVITALQAPYPLLSANLDRHEISDIYKHPVFTQGLLSSQPEVRQSLSNIIRLSHGNRIDSQQLNAMLAIQQQRDRRMAQSLSAAPMPSLLIAGAYHAAKNLGVPLHMQDIGIEKPPTVLMLVEKGASNKSDVADYQWEAKFLKP